MLENISIYSDYGPLPKGTIITGGDFRKKRIPSASVYSIGFYEDFLEPQNLSVNGDVSEERGTAFSRAALRTGRLKGKIVESPKTELEALRAENAAYERQRQTALAWIEARTKQVQGPWTGRVLGEELEELRSILSVKPAPEIMAENTELPKNNDANILKLPDPEKDRGKYELWENHISGETPITFLERVWGKYLNRFNGGNGDYLTQVALRGQERTKTNPNPIPPLDRKLFFALAYECKNHGKDVTDYVPRKSDIPNRLLENLDEREIYRLNSAIYRQKRRFTQK